MAKRKIAIVGSRTFPFPPAILEALEPEAQALAVQTGRDMVDSWAAEFAEAAGIEVIVIRPEWKKYGRRAGFKRNGQIVDEADDVVAYWDGQSKGTIDTTRKAHKQEKPYVIFGPDGEPKLAVTKERFDAAREPAPEMAIPGERPHLTLIQGGGGEA